MIRPFWSGRQDKSPAQTQRRSSADFGAKGEVEAGAVARQPHQQDAGPFKDRGHPESARVERPQADAPQKRGDLRLRLGAVAGEERVERLVLSEDVAEDRVQRFYDGCVLGSGSGDLLGRRVAWG